MKQKTKNPIQLDSNLCLWQTNRLTCRSAVACSNCAYAIKKELIVLLNRIWGFSFGRDLSSRKFWFRMKMPSLMTNDFCLLVGCFTAAAAYCNLREALASISISFKRFPSPHLLVQSTNKWITFICNNFSKHK